MKREMCVQYLKSISQEIALMTVRVVREDGSSLSSSIFPFFPSFIGLFLLKFFFARRSFVCQANCKAALIKSPTLC